MKEHLRKTIEYLKIYVQHNLSVIQKNEKEIKEILQEPVSNARSHKLDIIRAINKALLKENNDYLNLQMHIIQIMDKHARKMNNAVNKSLKFNNKQDISPVEENNEQEESEKEFSFDDLFTMTINGELPYNEKHPLFEDTRFYNNLMSFYIEKENYEMCNQLKKLKN